MKRLFVLAILMTGFLNLNAFAQETAAAEEITEQELERFATMEDSVMAFYDAKSAELLDMIKNNETIDDAARYNSIKAAWGKEEKMEEINITEEEKAAYQEILDFIEALSEEVRTLKTDIIMDKEFLGPATYNKINTAMKNDPSVKEKVDTMIAEKKEKRKVNTDDLASDGGKK